MNLEVGDVVACRRNAMAEPQEGFVVAIDANMIYVHFKGCNKRMDVWVPSTSVTFISKPVRRRYGDKSDKCETGLMAVRNVETITFGNYNIHAWYYSPYADRFIKDKHIYVCDYCLLYFRTQKEYCQHCHCFYDRRPPGVEIYRHGDVSLFEVLPKDQKLFCQCLSLLGKLFIEQTDAYYHVDNYVFYVLCLADEHGSSRIIGFFSRSTQWADMNIMSSLVVFPPWQQHGYGSLMIGIAYEMSRRKGIIGHPEHPLGDLGTLAFRSFWKQTILNTLKDRSTSSIDSIVEKTAISKNDVLSTLKELDLLLPNQRDLSINAAMKYIDTETVSEPKIDFRRNQLLWFPKSLEL